MNCKEYIIELVTKNSTDYYKKHITDSYSIKKLLKTNYRSLDMLTITMNSNIDVLKIILFIKKHHNIQIKRIIYTNNEFKKNIINNNVNDLLNDFDNRSIDSTKMFDYSSDD